MEDVSAAGSSVTVAGAATFEARQFNFENCGTCAYLSGVPAVLIGFKEEGDTTEVSASSGAKVDVLGGLAYIVWNKTDSTTPLFRADSTSTLAASFDEAVISSCCTIANYLDESINGQHYLTPASTFQSAPMEATLSACCAPGLRLPIHPACRRRQIERFRLSASASLMLWPRALPAS